MTGCWIAAGEHRIQLDEVQRVLSDAPATRTPSGPDRLPQREQLLDALGSSMPTTPASFRTSSPEIRTSLQDAA